MAHLDDVTLVLIQPITNARDDWYEYLLDALVGVAFDVDTSFAVS
jgi:hypothetical protein